MDERLELLEGQVVQLLAAADGVGRTGTGCGCPACRVLIPLLSAVEDQVVIDLLEGEMREVASREIRWGDLRAQDSPATQEVWGAIIDRMREVADRDRNLWFEADNNRGSYRIEGLEQGMEAGVRLLVRQLQLRYGLARSLDAGAAVADTESNASP